MIRGKGETVSKARSEKVLGIFLAVFLLMLFLAGNYVLSEARKDRGGALFQLGATDCDKEKEQKEDEISRLEKDFVKVPGGTFEMGDVFGNGDFDEKPVHLITLSGFLIGRHEVTQAQWKAVMGYNPSNYPGNDKPVENLFPEEVDGFLQRLNSLTGGNYRLPTEAEWEYAARSGGKREVYSGADKPEEVGWYFRNSGRPGSFPVGTKKPNGLGIYDMSGNVWELCSDWYDEKYYSKSPDVNPQGPSEGVYRVVRGGRWGYDPRSSRCTNRFNDFRLFLWRDSLGFRLARSE